MPPVVRFRPVSPIYLFFKGYLQRYQLRQYDKYITKHTAPPMHRVPLWLTVKWYLRYGLQRAYRNWRASKRPPVLNQFGLVGYDRHYGSSDVARMPGDNQRNGNLIADSVSRAFED